MATTYSATRGAAQAAATLPPRTLSLDEFLRLPEKGPALEFENGRVTQKVSPKGRHSALQTGIAQLFDRIGRRRGAARAFTELRFSFGGHSYVPDVSVYRRQRIPRTPDGKVADDFRAPPDIAVEIVSPGQSVNAVLRRCLWYVAHEVRAAITVDPNDESVILFRPGATPVVLRGPDQLDLGDIIPDLIVPVDRFFAMLLP